jgi:tetratricopeptide (TPR) repeat protein
MTHSASSGRRGRGPLALGVAAALLMVHATARADVSIWDVAKQPRLARAENVLHGVERMLARADEASFDPGMQADFARSALAMIEIAGGSDLPDVRLRYLLGDLLIDSNVGRYREARTILRRALREAPGHPLAGHAWFDLAIADAKLDKPKEEIDAYGHALETTWDPDSRANIYLNRAESRMLLGDLKGALKDYRRAIPLAARPELQALAYYGLGIVLERSGDLPSALDAMATASSIRLPLQSQGSSTALDLPSVFFVPAFDRYYYRALEQMAAARPPAAPQVAARALKRAIRDWTEYLVRAKPARAPWVRHAELLLASCQKKLAENEARIKPRSKRRRKAAR